MVDDAWPTSAEIDAAYRSHADFGKVVKMYSRDDVSVMIRAETERCANGAADWHENQALDLEAEWGIRARNAAKNHREYGEKLRSVIMGIPA